jgi:DNA-binding transcriptional ArsR family regulator
MAKQKPELIDSRLARALEHPIRVEILALLQEGPSSPAQIQRQMDNVSLNLISHHMKVLKDLECVELVETVNKKGARVHIYRAKVRPIIPDEVWAELTPTARKPLLTAMLSSISVDLVESLRAGIIDEILDAHFSRSVVKLDREGWSEISSLLNQILREVAEIGTKSLSRAKASGETPVSTTVALLQFPTVDGEDEGE